MVSRGPFVLEVPGHTFRFELHDYGGPYVLGKMGRPLADQPGPHSIFWEAYRQWERQGRQLDDQGRCIFKWETTLEQMSNGCGQRQIAGPTMPHMATDVTVCTPLKTAKVTIRSTPQDAEIFADGKFVGNAPALLTLPVGKHHFRVALEGYDEWSKELELIPDSELTLAANLSRC
jgi:hypothetical protein